MSCVAELVRLGKFESDLKDAGVRVICLSTDSSAKMAQGREHFGLPFRFVSDEDRKVIDRLGLRHPHGGPGGDDIFYATTFLIDRKGTVRWKHVATDVRDRATPSEILAAARAIVASDRSGPPPR